MKKIRIGFVDDHSLFLDGLLKIVESFNDFEIVFISKDGESLLNILENGTKVEIIVLDIIMPHMDGMEVSIILKKKFPSIKILILSMFDEKKFIEKLEKHIGVDGFIQKNFAIKEFEIALLNVSKGIKHFPQKNITDYLDF